jgi:hypothetical protein
VIEAPYDVVRVGLAGMDFPTPLRLEQRGVQICHTAFLVGSNGANSSSACCPRGMLL